MIDLKSETHSPQKVAVIGCGYWGRNLIRNFHEIGALACVSDRSDEVASDISRHYGVEARSLNDALSDPHIDGIVVATPAEHHAWLVEQALLSDKHVFVEKPLALFVEEAVKLCQLADERQRVLMVGHLLQYHPAYVKLRDLCTSGSFGKLQYVYSHRLNLGKFRREENSLWSFAPHDISMIIGLLGTNISSVSAVGHNYLYKSVADVTVTHLSFESGQSAHVYVSWLHPFKEQRLVIIGENGMAVFDDTKDWNEKLAVYSHKIVWDKGNPQPARAEPEYILIEAAEPLKLECSHFLDCIANQSLPRTDGWEGQKVLRILDAAQRSLEIGKAVSLFDSDKFSPGVSVHETAVVDDQVKIGANTKIWHFSHILRGCRIGDNCNIGQNVVVGPEVTIGNNCRIQNNISVYKGVTLEDNVFCGPSVVFTNVINPRSEIDRKQEFKKTSVRTGATIGANATIVCGNTIGRYAMIGAGAVVTRNVPDYALVVGNPGRVDGYVCRCGDRLAKGQWKETECGTCHRKYENDGVNIYEKQ